MLHLSKISLCFLFFKYMCIHFLKKKNCDQILCIWMSLMYCWARKRGKWEYSKKSHPDVWSHFVFLHFRWWSCADCLTPPDTCGVCPVAGKRNSPDLRCCLPQPSCDQMILYFKICTLENTWCVKDVFLKSFFICVWKLKM